MTDEAKREDAEDLREQAASCRRLAKRTSTIGGSTALNAAAEEYDNDARRMDPSSERR